MHYPKKRSIIFPVNILKITFLWIQNNIWWQKFETNTTDEIIATRQKCIASVRKPIHVKPSAKTRDQSSLFTGKKWRLKLILSQGFEGEVILFNIISTITVSKKEGVYIYMQGTVCVCVWNLDSYFWFSSSSDSSCWSNSSHLEVVTAAEGKVN